MYTCVWEFMVSEGAERAFERIYASDGAWTELFRKSPGYISTGLYHDTADARRYLTIDRWQSKSAFDDLRQLRHDEYLTLDGRCSCLIDSERLIGEIDS
jgi:heme-degrading monooxygenase HmoA